MKIDEQIQSMQSTIENFIATENQLQEELKAANEETKGVAADAVAKVEASAEKLTGIANEIMEIKQATAENVMNGKSSILTLGQMVIESEQYANFAKGDSTKMSFQANTITGQDGNNADDTLVPADRYAGIVPGAFRALKLADIIPQGNTTQNAVEYTRELLFTNAAAETAEGAASPESTLTFELVNDPVRNIAHHIKVSRQVLDDAPMLQSYIDTRMRYGVDFKVDSQIINGDGTGQNLSGILTTGNHTAFTPTADENQIDAVNRGIEKVALGDYGATGIVMNPADWYAISRIKRGAADDAYVFGDPNSPMRAMLWGLPVVVTNACPAGKFIVASFDIAFMLFNRNQTTVEMFEQDGDNATKQLLTVQGTTRKALASMRPASCFAGDLLAA